jgi:hypothetical protein
LRGFWVGADKDGRLQLEEPDQRYGRLLRARRERPYRRASEQSDEPASPHIGSQAQDTAFYPLKEIL